MADTSPLPPAAQIGMFDHQKPSLTHVLSDIIERGGAYEPRSSQPLKEGPDVLAFGDHPHKHPVVHS